MPYKKVLFRSAARDKILRGATQLADAVRVTLGPRSKSVLIEKKWGAPIICNDGVTIAKEFELLKRLARSWVTGPAPRPFWRTLFSRMAPVMLSPGPAPST